MLIYHNLIKLSIITNLILFFDYIFLFLFCNNCKIAIQFAIILKKSNTLDVYDFMNKSYVSHITIEKIISSLNLITSFVFIKQIYVTVAIRGKIPIKPKLLKVIVNPIAKIIIIIFSFVPNLSF